MGVSIKSQINFNFQKPFPEGTVEGIAELEELVTPLSSHDDILYFAIGVTIFSFLMICFAIAAVSRAKLAAALFAEAGKGPVERYFIFDHHRDV